MTREAFIKNCGSIIKTMYTIYGLPETGKRQKDLIIRRGKQNEAVN